MKLISLNTEHSLHDDLVLALLKKEEPDVICVQELLEENFEFYKKQLGIPGVYQFLYHETSAPGFIGKKSGIAIFSKNMAGHKVIPFNDASEKRDRNFMLLVAQINMGKEVFQVMTTHLPVTHHGSVTPFQLKLIDSLLATLEGLGEFVFCGDMNAPRGREAFSRLAAKYKDNIPTEYVTSLDQNLHRVKGLQYMVDGLFTTPAYQASQVKLVDGVSDHLAIVATINKI